MTGRWRIELFGGVRAEQEGRVITRFRTQKTAVLLAYLAYHPQRPHPREVLIEVLWPDCDLDAGRSRLSIALSSLRHQLEPPGVPAGSVIVADRSSVCLNPDAVTTDVAEFEAAMAAATKAGSTTERTQYLTQAVELYHGELLSGFYEEWVQPGQQRLSELYLRAVRRLTAQLEQGGDLEAALRYAARAVAADPLREESHGELIRLYAVAGQPSAALRQYRELERILQEELGQAPAAATRDLARSIQARASAAEAPVAARPPSVPAPDRPDAGRREGAPGGTVTFLMTDIEGSTSLWQRAGEAFKTALGSHHSLLRRAFRAHNGYEANEAGDSFVVAFERAGDALACAIAGQRALAEHVWPPEVGELGVRMALHTGDVERRGAEYRGLVLHHASRIVMAAHGGQIVCSEATAAVLRRGGIAALELGVRLTDLGVFRLRDVETPERLFQAEYPDMARREFPPPNTAIGYSNNLPLQLTRFFGRETGLAQLRELLLSDEVRLVTLTGPGGSGKTRLALQAAGQLVEALQGAVWFVPLADLADPRLIADAVLSAVRLPRSPHAAPLEQVVEALSRQPALLVLDNLEHLVADGALLVRALLERVPTLKCLVTSRQRLDLGGERELLVFPLPTPVGAATPERLTLSESVQLFVDRAQAVRPDFQITASNAPTVAELCRRLEGIPLALELAASRAQVLTPAQMLAQLGRRFDFLVSRRRDAVARHRTLRAAIEWGYQLMAPELQRFFARLSVFRGGWTLDAAEAVCEAGAPQGVGPGPGLALDYLAQLQECSLVVADEDAVGMRFGMLETLREFAAERLTPVEQAVLHRRHAEYCLALALQVEPELRGPDLAARFARIEAELENIRAALDWSAAARQVGLGLALADSLVFFWDARGYLAEGRERIEQFLSMPEAAGAPIEHRVYAYENAGWLSGDQGDYTAARDRYEEALAIHRSSDDRISIARCCSALGSIVRNQGDYPAARSFLEEAIAICRSPELLQPSLRQLMLAVASDRLAEVARCEGELEQARRLYEEALKIKRAAADRRGLALTLNWLGRVLREQQHHAAARAALEESLMLGQEIGDKISIAWALNNLGHLSRQQGDYAAARALHAESLTMRRELWDRGGILECLEGLVHLAAAEGEPVRAARLLGAAASLREALGSPLPPGDRVEYDQLVTRLHGALDSTAFDAAWEAGRALTWQQAADEAQSSVSV